MGKTPDDSSVPEMDIDEVLENSGPCGKFQNVFSILILLAVCSVSYHAIESYFTGNDPPWKCVANNNTITIATAAYNTTSPLRHHSNYKTSSNASNFCMRNINKTFSSDNANFYKRCDMKRNEWNYTTSKMYSFVTEFDLVCDEAVIAAFASGSVFVGGLLGSVVFGNVADNHGRKLVMMITLLLVIISSIGCSYVSNIWQLVGLRLVLGGAQMSCYGIAYVTLLEFVAPSYRGLLGMLHQSMFCLSQLIIDVAAYFERDWRSLQFYSSFGSVLPLLLFFLSPNSPRWLVSKGRIEKAKHVLEKIIRYNKASIPDFRIKTQIVQEESSYTYFHLFNTRRVFLLTSQLVFIWITCACMYFAIALESSNLGGGMYQAFGLTVLADLPSYFVGLFSCNIFGRKKTVVVSIFAAGFFIGATGCVPQWYEKKYIVNITLSMLAKFFTTTAFNGIFLWTVELYPTVLRSQGMSYCIAWERFGAFCAPFLISVLQRVSYVLPYIIMSVAAFTCGLTGLILPETLGCPTREAYEDFFDRKKQSKRENEIKEEAQMCYYNKSLDKD